MEVAWLITMPAAGLVGAVMWYLADLIGGTLGAIVIFLVLIALATLMWLRSRRRPINQHNVNDEWDETPAREHVSAGSAN
jgi:PiT family inorganic phosphate transporter